MKMVYTAYTPERTVHSVHRTQNSAIKAVREMLAHDFGCHPGMFSSEPNTPQYVMVRGVNKHATTRFFHATVEREEVVQ